MSFRKLNDTKPYALDREQIEALGMENVRAIIGEGAGVTITELAIRAMGPGVIE